MANEKIDIKNRVPNKLAGEMSPYLLQHAYNPVEWFPWGLDAFELARATDKPILLSIGYSSCHWCHVMETEVFDDIEAARAINDAFVSIKVDREERPDIDSVYMLVAQIMTNSGGWPLNIIMTPEKKPFFAGTYIGKHSQHGRIGMIDLAESITDMWNSKREELLSVSQEVTKVLTRASGREGKSPGEGEVNEETLKRVFSELVERFDESSGGFGPAPKFPTTQNIQFLFRYWLRFNDPEALKMAEETLKAMMRGGIKDHLGGGFHRYSTDAEWLVPHFEKMLYDQALISTAYIEAYQATGKSEYKDVAASVFDYVIRDLTGDHGAFLSGEDADSEGVEGKFYVWSAAEIDSLLDLEEREFARRFFCIEDDGNFIDEATGVRSGDNILHMSSVSPVLDISDAKRLLSINDKLLKARDKRERPALDDKVLTDWNGLMISALSLGASAFDNADYVEAAKRAAGFVIEKMMTADGRLLHRYRAGESAIDGFADDYAFLIKGLIDLYEATFDAVYLSKAVELQKVMIEDFWDANEGGFFFTTEGNKDVIVRQKNFYDGALPSGNSLALSNLLRLASMTNERGFEKKAMRLASLLADLASPSGLGFLQFINSADFLIGPSYEVVIIGEGSAEDTRAMIKAINSTFLPNKVVLFRPTDVKAPLIDELSGFTGSMEVNEGSATAYVCKDRGCNRPTNDIEETLALLKAR
ncbi:MAG: thioredoxin domain-containing protein [Thermodesulfobacteriota bacterium]